MKKNSRAKKLLKKIEGFFSYFKHRFIVIYLEYKAGFNTVLRKYQSLSNKDCEPISSTSPVWICWWQGEQQMPNIVKACVNSIRMHARKHPVIIVDKCNYQKYVRMPEEIMQKLQEGIIDITHFSDILRMRLLSTHGGVWMDATILLPSKDIDSFIVPENKYWSCHHLPIYHNISKGGWTSFFVACGKGNILPQIIYELHIKYWTKHNWLINYLLLDYTFAIARKKVKAVHDMIEEIPISVMGPLGKCLHEEWNQDTWEHFCEDFNFHKITYKLSVPERTSEGKLTNYGYIMQKFFPRA